MGFRGGSHGEWRGRTMADAPGWKPDPERAIRSATGAGRPGPIGCARPGKPVRSMSPSTSPSCIEPSPPPPPTSTPSKTGCPCSSNGPTAAATPTRVRRRPPRRPPGRRRPSACPDPPDEDDDEILDLSATRTLRATTPSRALPATPRHGWTTTIRRMLPSPNSTRHWLQRSRTTPRCRTRRRGGCFAVPDVCAAPGEPGQQPNGGTIRRGRCLDEGVGRWRRTQAAKPDQPIRSDVSDGSVTADPPASDDGRAGVRCAPAPCRARYRGRSRARAARPTRG